MTDPTLSTLAFIGLAFGGVAAARILVRVVLILGGVVRALANTEGEEPLSPSSKTSYAA
jgi:hypothetical protein